MTVPPPEPDETSDDPADLVPEGDRAAQAESAWPDEEDDGPVPDPDRIVIDGEE
jgi:hypothetical protein